MKQIRSFDRTGLPPGGVRFLADGREVLIGTLGKFELWDVSSGTRASVIKLAESCRTIGVWDVLPDDAGIVMGCREGGFVLFDLDGKVLRDFELSTDAEAYLSEESPGLATFGAKRNRDGSWEDLSRRFKAYTTPSSISLDGQGNIAAVAYGQTYVLVWDLGSGDLLEILGDESSDGHPNRIFEVAVSSDGELAALRGHGDQVAVWQIRGRRKTSDLPVAGPDFSEALDRPADMPSEASGRGGVGAMAFVPGSSNLAVAEGPDVRHLDSLAGTGLGTWTGHGVVHPIMGEYRDMPRIHDLRFSTDGRRALTVGVDSTIRVWDVATGSQISSVRPDPCCVDWADLSRDGSRVIWAGCPGVRVYALP